MNNEIYIGSTAISFKRRWICHLSSLKAKTHTNAKLQHVYNKYGKDIFEFEIIEECSPDQCIKREQYYMDILHPFYNIRKNADNNFGLKRSKETCRKIGLAKKGNKFWLGRNHTEESKKKMSIFKQGRPNNIETTIKLGIPIISINLMSGIVSYFISIADANKETKIHRTTISRHIKIGTPIKNYMFILDEKAK